MWPQPKYAFAPHSSSAASTQHLASTPQSDLKDYYEMLTILQGNPTALAQQRLRSSYLMPSVAPHMAWPLPNASTHLALPPNEALSLLTTNVPQLPLVPAAMLHAPAAISAANAYAARFAANAAPLPMDVLADILLRWNTSLLSSGATPASTLLAPMPILANSLPAAAPAHIVAAPTTPSSSEFKLPMLPSSSRSSITSSSSAALMQQKRQRLQRKRSQTPPEQNNCEAQTHMAENLCKKQYEKLRDVQADSTGASELNCDLLPPPKKKWIRHYLKEDAFSTNSSCSPSMSSHKSAANNEQQQQAQQQLAQQQQPTTLQPQQQESSVLKDKLPNHAAGVAVLKYNNKSLTIPNHNNNNNNSKIISSSAPSSHSATFCVVDGKASTLGASNSPLLSNSQALFVSAGQAQLASSLPAKVLSNKSFIKLSPPAAAAAAFSFQAQHSAGSLPPVVVNASCLPATNAATASSSILRASTVRTHKTISPLTPPPMSSKKFIETRIRSYSLSNKFSANHQLLLHNGAALNGGGSSNHMIIEDAHMSYGGTTSSNSLGSNSNSSSNHSPPRHAHYMQLLSSSSSSVAAAGSAGSQLSHAAVPNTLVGAGSGRRRTISSNSNGAGTREVHNKLEKNRRAHLKECYEALNIQLQLKEEDRKKPSNLAILGEAYKHVVSLQQQDHELETNVEDLAKKKINLQKKINILKRELGPKLEMLSGILPDIDVESIPSEREAMNETGSLSSGRGSMLYSSSSSLSSGGSNGSNTMSSPVGAGLQTAMPTAISPVISSKINNNNNSNHNNNNNNNAQSASNSSIINKTTVATTITTTPLATQIINNNNNLQQQFKLNNNNNNTNSSPIGSPNAFLNGMPLSLTAKNISATSLTRGSPTPTPSTPSPSPSSSSGISSSSSMISASPPMINSNSQPNSTAAGMIINGRNVTVNIPNGLKLQPQTAAVTAAAAANATTIGNGSASAVATIIATSPPGSSNVAANGTNAQNLNSGSNGLSKLRQRKSPKHGGTQFSAEQQQNGEQPSKMLKFINGQILESSVGGGSSEGIIMISPTKSQENLIITTTAANAAAAASTLAAAELLNGSQAKSSTAAAAAAMGTLYHANAKLMLLNGSAHNGILLKEPFVVSSNGSLEAATQAMTPIYVSSNSSGSPQHLKGVGEALLQSFAAAAGTTANKAMVGGIFKKTASSSSSNLQGVNKKSCRAGTARKTISNI